MALLPSEIGMATLKLRAGVVAMRPNDIVVDRPPSPTEADMKIVRKPLGAYCGPRELEAGIINLELDKCC